MLLFLPHCEQANEMAIRNNFIYYVQSSLGKKILLAFQNLLLLAPLPACDVFVSVAFLKAQKDNLRGLIRVGKVSYKYFRQDCKLKQSLK